MIFNVFYCEKFLFLIAVKREKDLPVSVHFGYNRKNEVYSYCFIYDNMILGVTPTSY